jgi:tetratricopeptide (TPR) repeat protein
MKDYQRSLSDIDEVLLLEPRHFGALSGRAQISIKLKKYEKAINDLLKVKEINPSSRGDQLIEKLKGLIKGLDI